MKLLNTSTLRRKLSRSENKPLSKPATTHTSLPPLPKPQMLTPIIEAPWTFARAYNDMSPLLSLPPEVLQVIISYTASSTPFPRFILPINHNILANINDTCVRLRRESIEYLRRLPDPWRKQTWRFTPIRRHLPAESSSIAAEPGETMDWTIAKGRLACVLMVPTPARVWPVWEWALNEYCVGCVKGLSNEMHDDWCLAVPAQLREVEVNVDVDGGSKDPITSYQNLPPRPSGYDSPNHRSDRIITPYAFSALATTFSLLLSSVLFSPHSLLPPLHCLEGLDSRIWIRIRL